MMNVPFTGTMRKLVNAAVEKENAAMRLAAVAPERFRPLLEEAQRRQDMHEALCNERGWLTIVTAGLDSVYEDVCHGRL
jgi:hypothetical protein